MCFTSASAVVCIQVVTMVTGAIVASNEVVTEVCASMSKVLLTLIIIWKREFSPKLATVICKRHFKYRYTILVGLSCDVSYVCKSSATDSAFQQKPELKPHCSQEKGYFKDHLIAYRTILVYSIGNST